MNRDLNMLSNHREKRWLSWLITVILLLLIIMLNGIALVPPQHYQKLSQNPFLTRTDIHSDNYFQETVLLPLLAYYTGWSDVLSFNALCFFMLIAAYLYFSNAAFHEFEFRTALMLIAILIASPLSTILFSWLGTPDSLTFLLTMPLLFTSSVFLIFIISILGVTNHIIFMFAAFEILVLRWIAKDGIKPFHIALQLVAAVIGYLLVRLFLAVNHIHIISRLDYIFSKDLNSWVALNSLNFYPTIFSFFSIQWILLLVFTVMFFSKDRFFYLATWAFLILNFVITFFTLDKTRIFSLLSWGIMMQCLFHSLFLNRKNHETSDVHKFSFVGLLTIVGSLSFLVPRYYSWEGKIVLASVWKFIIDALT